MWSVLQLREGTWLQQWGRRTCVQTRGKVLQSEEIFLAARHYEAGPPVWHHERPPMPFR